MKRTKCKGLPNDLVARQIRNRWKKRTINNIAEFWVKAPTKLKESAKYWVQDLGYTKESGYMPSAFFECYRWNVSKECCNQLIDHYS